MHTPETANSLNEPAISMAVRAYDAANALNNKPKKFAFNNAINALRRAPQFINTLELAQATKYLTNGRTGEFVIESASGMTPRWLQELERELAERQISLLLFLYR
jgi:hypothetical protein